MKPMITTYCDRQDNFQKPADVAVLVPSRLKRQIKTALRSVFQQEFDGRIHIVIGIMDEKARTLHLDQILKERPAHISVTCLWPGYSLSDQEPAKEHGYLISAMACLANARRITYLEDDHWVSPDHLKSLVNAMGYKAWATTKRWFVQPDAQSALCEDQTPVHDPHCLIFDKVKAFESLSKWAHKTSEDAYEALFHGLRAQFPDFGQHDKPTVSFCLSEKDEKHIEILKDIQENKKIQSCPDWVEKPKTPKTMANETKEFGNIHILGDVERSFDISVVIPTIARPSLINTVRSLYRQTHQRPIQIMIGIDKPVSDVKQIIKSLETGRPDHISVFIYDPEFSTSARHGGVHPARDGGSLRSFLSYLAKAPFIAYMDDDNRILPTHLQDLRQTIIRNHFAFSYRRFIHPDGVTYICDDQWESVGPKKGMYADKFDGFIDPNCLMIRKSACLYAIAYWTRPLSHDPEGMSADRNVSRFLSKFAKGEATGKATVDYILSTDDPMTPIRAIYLGERWINAHMASLRKKLRRKRIHKKQAAQ
jgi:glycosyltransferase involved in cell wall biosynthesis